MRALKWAVFKTIKILPPLFSQTEAVSIQLYENQINVVRITEILLREDEQTYLPAYLKYAIRLLFPDVRFRLTDGAQSNF